LGVPEKVPFGCSSRGELQRTPGEGEEAATPSDIKISQIVHGREVMPRDGGIILSENVQVKPFFPKSKLNAKLGIRVLGRTVRSNSLPSGRTDLHHRDLGLKKNLLKGIVIVKMFSASFRPEMVENEATEDV